MAVILIEPPEGKKLPSIEPSVICRCGYKAHWERFNEDGLGFPLPPMTFRCPSCKWQWRRVRVPHYYPDGSLDRIQVEIQTIENPTL